MSVEQQGAVFRRATPILDQLEGIEYRTRVEGGRCVLAAAEGRSTLVATADYVFGSGGLAFTYVSRSRGVSTELRLSHYALPDAWQFTPGQRVGRRRDSPLGHVLDAKTERACFSCHATAVAVRDGELAPEHSLLGIGCETCHGPGAEHVQAVRRGASDLRMVDLRPLRRRVSMELCGACHRSPGSVNLSSPGAAAQLPRLQSLALSFSSCFKKGGVSCMTCHNPHENAGVTPPAGYNRRCSSCHAPAAPGQVACKVQPAGNCVSCHMPEQDIGMPAAVRFRNHWIKVWR